ncbi:hypothetical protein KY312_01360 [Candidatus Woesearchaeota archaeon]|nr:hypothetical protein [Candidatus Woesearchaeota archaeon]
MRTRQISQWVGYPIVFLLGWSLGRGCEQEKPVQLAKPVQSVRSVQSAEPIKQIQDKNLEKSVEKQNFKKFKAIIPGTYSYDIDSGCLPHSADRIEDWAKALKVNLSYDPTNLKYGAESSECDIFFSHQTRKKRSLRPRNGAEIINLGKIDFDSITLEHLTDAEFSDKEIVENDDMNDDLTGTVVGIKTNNGKFAKMRVDGYLPLNRPAKNIKNYNMKCTFVLYSAEQDNEEVF